MVVGGCRSLVAEHWRPLFFLSLCCFKGLRTVTAQIISIGLRTWVSPVYRAPYAVIKLRFFRDHKHTQQLSFIYQLHLCCDICSMQCLCGCTCVTCSCNKPVSPCAKCCTCAKRCTYVQIEKCAGEATNVDYDMYSSDSSESSEDHEHVD